MICFISGSRDSLILSQRTAYATEATTFLTWPQNLSVKLTCYFFQPVILSYWGIGSTSQPDMIHVVHFPKIIFTISAKLFLKNYK